MHATLITAKEIGLWNALRVVRADLHKLCTSRGMSSFDFNAKIMRELGLPVGSQSGFESEMANNHRLNEFGAGRSANADDGQQRLARSSPISAGQSTNADDGQALAAGGNPTEADHVRIAEGLKSECPPQPVNGRGQLSDANDGQDVRAPSVIPKQPTQDQIASAIRGKQALAKSLFETLWLGKAIGSWSYRGLLSIQKDGEVASALIAEIGEIGEDDKDREVIQLLGGSEERLRRALAAGKKSTPKDA